MKKPRGWTLIEVLIVITVTAVAGGLMINILINSNKLFFDQSAQISHGLSLNQASSEISDLIRSSVSVAPRYPATGTVQYTTDSDTLIIKLPALTAGGDVKDLIYDYAVIEKDSVHPNVLRKYIYPDNQSSRKTENEVLSTDLKTITFNYFDSTNHNIAPDQSARVNFIINLSTASGFSSNESSSSGIVNLKNI